MKSTNSKRFLSSSVFLMWVVICLSLFLFYTGTVSFMHQFVFKNIDSMAVGFSRAEGSRFFPSLIASLFGVLLFSSSCIVLGLFTLSFWGDKLAPQKDTFLGWLAYMCTAFLIGEIVSSSVFLLLGNMNKLTAGAVGSVMVIMVVLGLYPSIRIFKNGPLSQLQKHQPDFANRFDRFLKFASILIIFLTLFYSSARLSYDAVGMYFSDEKLIAMTGRIQYFSDVFVVSSLHVGMQYAAIIKIFGDQAARMYSWIGGLIILVFGLAIGEKLGLSKRALLILQVMILTSTVFVDLMGDGKIDLQTSAPMFAAIYWMMLSKRTNPGRGIYFLIGLLAGFSIISRLFNAFLAFLFIGLFYLWEMYSRRINRKWDFNFLLRPVMGIGAGVFAMLGFHLFANQIIIGNALAPLEVLARVNSSVWHYSYDPNDMWIYRILYPFVVTYVNSPQSLGNVTPLFIAFLPSLLLKPIRKNAKFSKELISISVIAAIVLVLWVVSFYMIVEIRYVLFLWVILFVPIVVLVEQTLNIGDRIFTALLKLSIVSLLIFMICRIIFISFSTYSPLNEKGVPQCYDSLLCESIRPVNQTAFPGDRVLALNAYRYYMRPDLLACSSKADEYIKLQKAYVEGGVDAFWDEAYHQGYQYVIYEKNFTERHLGMEIVPDPRDTPAWITLESISGISGGDHVAYRLIAKNPPFKPDEKCNEVSPGLWLVEQVSQ